MSDTARRLAARIARLERIAKARQPLIRSTIRDGAVPIRNATTGALTGAVGEQWDATFGAVTLGGPVPPTPAAPLMETRIGGVIVRWGGDWDPAVNEATGLPVVAPSDFKGVEVQVSADPAFPGQSDFAYLYGPLLTSARGGDVFIPWPTPGVPLYSRLVARATSGKPSVPSPVTGPVESGALDLSDPATGGTTVSVTAAGIVVPALSVAGADTDGDGVPDTGLQVYGREWSDILWDLPWGTVAEGDLFNSDGSNIRSGINTAVGIAELSFTALAGRSYQFLLDGLQLSTDVAGTRGLFSLRATHDGTTPTVSNGVAYSSKFFYLPTANQGHGAPTFSFVRSYTSDTQVRVGLIVARQTGTGLINVTAYAPADAHFSPLRMAVVDSGPGREDTIILNDGSGSGSGSPTNPKKTYTTTWLQNWGATYTGSGPERTDSGLNGDLIQGFTSYYTAPGTMRALTALSGHAAAYSTDGGELSKTIVQALSGATVQKVEVKLHCKHTYSSDGGDAAIGYHGSLTKPASYPAAAYGILTRHFDRGQTRWISLPSSTFADWQSGAYRGITIGPKSSAAADYMRFTGTGSDRPAIRITYVR